MRDFFTENLKGNEMTRKQMENLILEQYGIRPDHPWMKDPDSEVFRHSDNRKWFALMMNVPKSKLGLAGDGMLSIANFKCDPILIGLLREESGFFPAYHMNKENWITVALDGSAPDEKIRMLLDMSFRMTVRKAGKGM